MAFIRLDDVSVDFPIYSAPGRSLKHRFLAASTGGLIGAKDGRISIKALDRVSVAIEHGDRVGLVGHNGAGKTTLLRVIAGIYEPVIGTVAVEGRTVPLFDVGLGIDLESSGLENIQLRGLFLGLSKAEIRRKTDEIAEFTGLGPFLDMPLRTYSSGMQARLTFAISTCIDPEVLLLDEGIGVGDAAFMEQATRRLDRLVQQTGILVLASHSEDLLRRLCNKAFLFEHGRLAASGSVDEILHRYQAAAATTARGTK
jgi:ABC-type polysaccharide/polyol phosphate transport system ATPase subunit